MPAVVKNSTPQHFYITHKRVASIAEKIQDKCPIENFDVCIDRCSSCKHYMSDHCQYPRKKRK